MSEQTLTLIDNTVVTLGEQLDSFDLVKIARRLSGDLRALILVYNSPETAVPAVLKITLKKLQAKVKLDISSLEEKPGKYIVSHMYNVPTQSKISIFKSDSNKRSQQYRF